MLQGSVFRRAKRLTSREIARFVEAACLLTAAWLAIKVLPFRILMRTTHFGRATNERSDDHQRVLGRDVRRAVQRAARRLPWTIVCFPEGLAAHWMLRRRGACSQLHYGLRSSLDKLSAHVWVTLAGEVVIGEETDDAHHCVATFPQPLSR